MEGIARCLSGAAAGIDEGFVAIATRIAGFHIDVIVASIDSGDGERKVAFEFALVPLSGSDWCAVVELEFATGDFATGARDVIEIVGSVLGFSGDDAMGVGWWGDWISAAASTGTGGSFVEDAKGTDVDGAAAFGLDGEGVGASSKVSDFAHLIEIVAGSSFETAEAGIFEILGWEG